MVGALFESDHDFGDHSDRLTLSPLGGAKNMDQLFSPMLGIRIGLGNGRTGRQEENSTDENGCERPAYSFNQCARSHDIKTCIIKKPFLQCVDAPPARLLLSAGLIPTRSSHDRYNAGARLRLMIWRAYNELSPTLIPGGTLS